MNGSRAVADRLAVLESLVCQVLGPAPARSDEAALFGPQIDAVAAATYFLLGLDRDGGVEQFVTHTLGRLLQQLTRSTEQRQVEYRGQVRGRVVWPATYKLRYSDDYDPTLFVCREVKNRYDTPENQLLVYVMGHIDDCLKSVPDLIRQGICYRPLMGRQQLLSTGARLARIETELNRLRRNVRLQEVSVPLRITEWHLLRAETARLEEYHSVARVYRRYRAAVLVPSWKGLVAAGEGALPLPASLDPPGDRWVRLGAAILRARHAGGSDRR